MLKRIIEDLLLGLGVLTVFLALCFFSARLAGTIGRKAAVNPPPPELADRYRNQGLAEDVILDGSPQAVTPSEVIFSDRVLSRCQWTQADTDEACRAANLFLEALQQENPAIRTYVSVMPLRLAFEGPFGRDSGYLSLVNTEGEKMKAIESQILEAVNAAAVPVFDSLKAQEDTYIFYRNEPVWTARGAYFGVQAFLEAAELPVFPLEDFWEYGKIGNDVDRHYYYLFAGNNPLILRRSKDGTEKKVPMISSTRSGSGVFLGNSTGGNLLKGFAANGRRLLIIGEGGTNVAAPWLVTSFEKILQIDLRYYALGQAGLQQLLREQEITDVYLLINLDTGDYSKTNPLPHLAVRLEELAGGGQKET